MRVKLIAWTPDPEVVAGAAAKSCWSKKPASEVIDEAKKLRKSLRRAVERGHLSVVEHAVFTFSIEGISRACSHQLVRHRIASYSQQSQRHMRQEDGYVVPPTIQASKEAEELYEKLMDQVWKGYKRLLELGIPEEDARFVLPNSARTNLVMTANARSLMNFFELRCCLKAQWEIRQLANEMLKLVRKVAPSIFKRAGPPCLSRGVCPEDDRSCGFYKKYVGDDFAPQRKAD